MTDKVIRFHVKLNIGADKREIIDSIPGFVDSFLLFHDRTNTELSSIYVVDFEPKLASDAMVILMAHPEVDYVEMPALRKSK